VIALIAKKDPQHTADRTALEPDGSRRGLPDCIRLSGHAGHAHQQSLATPGYKFIGSRTVCLANRPGIRGDYSPLETENVTWVGNDLPG